MISRALAQELAHSCVTESLKRPADATVFQHADFEIIGAEHPIGAGERARRRCAAWSSVAPVNLREAKRSLIVSASPPKTAKRGSSEMVPS